MAVVEDISKEGPQVSLHVNWLECGDSHCPQALYRTDLRDKIHLETVNDLVDIQPHSPRCAQMRSWCIQHLVAVAKPRRAESPHSSCHAKRSSRYEPRSRDRITKTRRLILRFTTKNILSTVRDDVRTSRTRSNTPAETETSVDSQATTIVTDRPVEKSAGADDDLLAAIITTVYHARMAEQNKKRLHHAGENPFVRSSGRPRQSLQR